MPTYDDLRSLAEDNAWMAGERIARGIELDGLRRERRVLLRLLRAVRKHASARTATANRAAARRVAMALAACEGIGGDE